MFRVAGGTGKFLHRVRLMKQMFRVASLAGFVNGRHFSGDGRGQFGNLKWARGGLYCGGNEAVRTGPTGLVTASTRVSRMVRPRVQLDKSVT